LIVSVDGRGLSVPAIQELIARRGEVIMDRFAAGETDPEVLKKIAVGGRGPRAKVFLCRCRLC
jgi:hypothetical protein